MTEAGARKDFDPDTPERRSRSVPVGSPDGRTVAHPMTYRLVALDIDGTVLRSDRRVSARTREAVARARAAGVHVVLVTGRRYPAARRVADEVGPTLPLVLHNGALIIAGGEVLACTPLPRSVAVEAIRIGRAQAADPVVHAGRRGEGRLVVERVAPDNPLLTFYLERSQPDVVRVHDLVAALEHEVDDPLEVMFGGSCVALEALVPVLEAGLGDRARVERTLYPQRGVAIVDVVSPAVGKAMALAFLCGHFGLARAQTLAVGDNWNDRAMLEWAGLGMVMGNAEPGLRALGLPLLPTNDEDGVACAIERYILGGPDEAHKL